MPATGPSSRRPRRLGRLRGVFAIFAAMLVLYFLDITVLCSGRQRNQEYVDFT